ncbi:MAG: glycosyltransferase family 4 protein [Saprospiraceae bacterium]
MMTIYFLTSINPYASEGASANRWRTIVDGLVLQGAIVKILITSGWSTRMEFDQYQIRGFIDSDCKIAYQYICKLSNFTLWKRRVNTYFLEYILQPFYRYSLNKIIKNEKFTILFVQPHLSVFRLFIGIPYYVLKELKVVMEISEFNDIGSEHATNFIQRKNVVSFNKLLLTHILPKLNGLIVMTNKLKEHFSSLLEKNNLCTLHHMPMTVDLERFVDVTPFENIESPYIAYCGTTSFKKDGIDILIQSFDKIVDNFPKVKLYIAAYYENDGDKMVDLIKRAKHRDSIKFLGVLHRDEIPSFVSSSTLCALPRPDSRQAQGGFPTKLGEYLASGRPVCVTTVGEIPLYLKDKTSAFFAIPGSIDSFADAMIYALQDKELANEVGKQGKIVAETSFNKNIQGKNLYNYLSILIKDAK